MSGEQIPRIDCIVRPHPLASALMRMPVTIAIFLHLACVSSRGDVLPVEGIHPTAHTKFYDITGQTVQQLVARMNEAGPVETDGKHYFARTDWTLKWQYRYETRAGRLVLTVVSLTVDANYSLPRKQPPAAGNDRMAAEWTRFLAAVALHERGHAENAMRHAKQLYATLRQQRTFANKEELEAFVNARGNQCIADASAEDLEYDKNTKHGDTQGATLREPAK